MTEQINYNDLLNEFMGLIFVDISTGRYPNTHEWTWDIFDSEVDFCRQFAEKYCENHEIKNTHASPAKLYFTFTISESTKKIIKIKML